MKEKNYMIKVQNKKILKVRIMNIILNLNLYNISVQRIGKNVRILLIVS